MTNNNTDSKEIPNKTTEEKVQEIITFLNKLQFDLERFVNGCTSHNLRDVVANRFIFSFTFSIADVYASVYDLYIGGIMTDEKGITSSVNGNSAQRIRFERYFERFCCENENEFYKSNFTNLSVKDFYDLRNQIVHSLSVSKKIIFQDYFDILDNDPHIQEFKSKGIILVNASNFINMIIKSANLFILLLTNDETNNKTKSKEGIDRIYDIFSKNFSVHVQIKK